MPNTGLTILLCCSLLGCLNHYARDFTAALAAQLEAPLPDGLGLLEERYHLLTTAYFVPNLVTPLLAGLAAQTVGPAATLGCAAAVATAGNLLFAVAVALRLSFTAQLLGRLCTGLSCMPSQPSNLD